MSDCLRDTILQSPQGQKMIDMVTPIYDRSYVGLWLFEVMGRRFDEIQKIVDEFPEQSSPQTATWAIDYWEQEYGITPDNSIPLARRRALIMAAKQGRGPFTPARLKAIAEAITGMSARVVENAGPYTFSVYLSAMTGDDQKLIAEVNRIKPAHLTFNLYFEQGVETPMYFAAIGSHGIQFEMRQVN